MLKPFLMIDMGGTYIRFLMQGQNISQIVNYQVSDFKTVFDAIDNYYFQTKNDKTSRLIMAVPGVTNGETLSFLNNPWTFSKTELWEKLNLSELKILNDFEGQVIAIPLLAKTDLYQIGAGIEQSGFPKGVLGAGTGLGFAYLIPEKKTWRPIGTEGGHVTISVQSGLEWQVFKILQKKYTHVSAERVISGQGIVNIYQALNKIYGKQEQNITPTEIMENACQKEDVSMQSIEMMFAWMGSVAGNMALALNALGGIYITGGIIQQKGVLDLLQNSEFRKRFENKGRRADYMRQIPTFSVVTHQRVFLGLEYLANQSVIT